MRDTCTDCGERCDMLTECCVPLVDGSLCDDLLCCICEDSDLMCPICDQYAKD